MVVSPRHVAGPAQRLTIVPEHWLYYCVSTVLNTARVIKRDSVACAGWAADRLRKHELGRLKHLRHNHALQLLVSQSTHIVAHTRQESASQACLCGHDTFLPYVPAGGRYSSGSVKYCRPLKAYIGRPVLRRTLARRTPCSRRVCVSRLLSSRSGQSMCSGRLAGGGAAGGGGGSRAIAARTASAASSVTDIDVRS